MKIVTTENILVEGQHKRRGSVVEINNEDGRLLVGIGRAIEFNSDSKECQALVTERKAAEEAERNARPGK